MATHFFTGFPGFLGSELVPRVLARSESDEAVCLIQPKFAALARQRVAEIMAREPRLEGRIRLVEGDITVPGLGLADAAALQREVAEVYHLAAVYDLSVPRRVGMKVNVDGTRYVLDFAEGCSALRRFQYVSTCYVSGAYTGIFRETDLAKGQRFNNYYEETKFLAEVEVQARMKKGLPATIYRDFVIGAISYLSGEEKAVGKVYQLADPDPLTIDEILNAVAKASHRLLVKVPLPVGVAKKVIDWVPFVYRVMQIPSSSIDYFVHPTFYDTAHTQADLAGTDLQVPPLRSYLPTLVSFMKVHPELGSEAMV